MLLATLAGCATPALTAATDTKAAAVATVVSTDTGCTAFARMTFDRLADTAPTIQQIKAYDAARDKVCGVGK